MATTTPSSTTRVPVADAPLDPSLAPDAELARECPAYVETVTRALNVAAGEGFADVEALDVFRVAPQVDNGGRVVFIFIPAHLPENDEAALERVTLAVFAAVHKIVVVEEREFTVLWLCNNNDDKPSQLSWRWWRSTYWTVPYVYHTRLRMLCVVHPSIAVRAKLFLLSYLPRHSFWERLDYADRLEFLDAHVPLALIKSLPQEVKDHDKYLDREMYASVQHAQQHGPAHAAGAAELFAQSSLNGGMSGLGSTGAGTAAGTNDAPPPLPKRNWED